MSEPYNIDQDEVNELIRAAEQAVPWTSGPVGSGSN